MRHPINILRIAGILDGISLIALLLIAMPLKYKFGVDEAVSIVGSIHGGIFVVYALTIIYTTIRVQWNFVWPIIAFIVAFIPFGNFIFDLKLKSLKSQYPVKPMSKTAIIYAIVFFSFIDLFAQLPVMSTFAESVGSSAFIAGIAVGMYSLTNTFGNVLSGILTDKKGPFRILGVGLLSTSIALMLYHFVDNPTILLVVRFIHGFVGGLIVPAAFTMIANSAEKSETGRKGATTGVFIGTAAIIGPAFSGILSTKISVPSVFSIIAIAGLLLLCVFYFLFKSHASATTERSTKNQKLKLTFNKGLIKSYVGAFFLMFSQGALAYLLPLHVQDLGYDSRISGTLLSVFGITAVLLFLLPTNRIFDRVSPVFTFSFGIGVLGISQILISQFTSSSTLYIALVCYGVGFAFLYPSINQLLIQSTTEETRGKAYGYFYAFFSLGVVVGSSLLGMLPITISGGFVLTGILLIVIAGVVLIDRKSEG